MADVVADNTSASRFVVGAPDVRGVVTECASGHRFVGRESPGELRASGRR